MRRVLPVVVPSLAAFLFAVLASPVAAGGRGALAHVPRIRHVVVVVFENEEAAAVAGSRAARHFNLYARAYADLTDDTAVAHPSLPNYLALVSGSTHGIESDCTACAASGPTIGTALSRRGRAWGGYAQGFPSSPLFAKKHMPFLYFAGQSSHVHPLSRLVPDRLPAFAFVAPDLCDDAHDCPLRTADRFLAGFLPPLLHVPSTAVYVLFDEGTSDAGGGGHIFAFVAGTAVRRHARFVRATDHYGVLRTIEDQLGVSPLGRSATHAPITGIWK